MTNPSHPAQSNDQETSEQTPLGAIDTAAQTLDVQEPATTDDDVADLDLTVEEGGHDQEDSKFSAKITPFETFEEAKLPQEVLEALKALGWLKPTPVQSMCLPHTLRKRDIAGFAQTGTGKTGVFLITVATNLYAKLKNPDSASKGPLALVICPTRELAMQIEQDAAPFFSRLGIKSTAVFGGSSWEEQDAKLKEGAHVVVATPGRLKDFEQSGNLNLSNVEIFVCDEVDRMFEMGFVEDVEFCLGKIHENSQKLLFSATTNERVKELAFEYLNYPEYISVNSDEITPERIVQHAYMCEAPQKFKILLGLLKRHNPECSIIFTNTKLTASWLKHKLEKNGISVDAITGDLPQAKRIKLIHKIKAGEIKALIATDVASRGLHISNVSHVYNFDIPDDAANYVHRIGRTARAGNLGESYSLVCEDYGQNFLAIKRLLKENTPTPVWPEEELINTEDSSGNPFTEGLELFGASFKDRPMQNDYQKDSYRNKGRPSFGGKEGGSRYQGNAGGYNNNRNRPEGGGGDRYRDRGDRHQSSQQASQTGGFIDNRPPRREHNPQHGERRDNQRYNRDSREGSQGRRNDYQQRGGYQSQQGQNNERRQGQGFGKQSKYSSLPQKPTPANSGLSLWQMVKRLLGLVFGKK